LKRFYKEILPKKEMIGLRKFSRDGIKINLSRDGSRKNLRIKINENKKRVSIEKEDKSSLVTERSFDKLFFHLEVETR